MGDFNTIAFLANIGYHTCALIINWSLKYEPKTDHFLPAVFIITFFM